MKNINITIEKISKIPIIKYLNILSSRLLTKQMAIDYTKQIYDIDISNEEILNHILWEYGKDVYQKFNDENPIIIPDDNTREWFNKYGNRRYRMFYKTYVESSGLWDMIQNILQAEHIHHIHPLIYGGTNNIKNLIPTTTFLHELLHKNPLEKEEKYCFQALDFLTYTSSLPRLADLCLQNSADQWTNKSLIKNMAKLIIESEMDSFYEELGKAVIK